MATDKKGREQLDRLATQMRDFMARIDAQNRPWTGEERTEYTRMEEDYTGQEAMVAARERSEDRLSFLREPAPGSGPQVIALNPQQFQELLSEFRMTPVKAKARVEAMTPRPGDSSDVVMQKLHLKAFSSYLRQPTHCKTIEGLSGEDASVLTEITKVMNAQSGNVGSQGGYVIPQGFSKDLFEAMKWFGGIDGVVDEFDTASGNPWPWPTVNDTMNKGRIIGQNAQVVETDIVFGQVTFNAYIGSSDFVLIPYALMEDSYFDLNGLAARLLGIRLGRLKNYQCTVGTGVGGPTGIVTAVVANGTVLVLPNGNTASISYGSLVDLEHSVDPAYRYNPATRWMFGDSMLKLIKKLVDGNNRPLWQPGLTASFRDGAAVDLTASRPTILDHPYVINQDMPTPAASANTIVFGDMNCFKVRNVAGGVTVQRLVERFADYMQVGFQAFMRFDSNEIDAGTHPLAVAQQSAT